MRENLLSFIYENASVETDIAFGYKRKLRRAHWTYAMLARTAFQFARELEERNIGKGDSIIIWSENCPEWVAAFYGLLLRGAVVVPVDEQSTIDFVERICEQTKPKLLLQGTKIDCSNLNVNLLSLGNLPAIVSRHSSETYAAQNIACHDTVEIVFTSGTTAAPKGVPLTHENILSNVEAIERVVRRYSKWKFLAHPIKILCLLPLSHVFGQMMGIFIPPLLRSEVVLQNRLNPSDILETVKRERVSVLATVPRILETLQNKIERDFDAQGNLANLSRQISAARKWSALKKWLKFRRIHSKFGFKFWVFVTGGASLSGESEEFWGKLGFVVLQGYGMTETAALISLNNPFKRLRRGSLGEILAGQEVKIDETGEILVRGKNVSRSILDSENQNDWLRTGDLGYLDETGRLYFKGRKKDVIVISAGLNVYPQDLEDALNRQPEIRQSAVVGIETESGTEPFAALILKSDLSPEKAVERANKLLAPHQQIRRWIVWTETDFPRTATMKIRKNAVAEIIRQKLASGAKETTSQTSALAGILSRIRSNQSGKVSPNTRLSEDLNLDSLARVELLSAVEESYHIDLDEQAFTAAETIEDIERLIKAEAPAIEKKARFTFPRRSLRFPVSFVRIAFYYLVILPLTLILCRVRTRGLENLESIKSPVIFASNHITEIDAALILSALPNRFRSKLAIAMDGEMLESFCRPQRETPRLTKLRLFFQYWLVIALFNVFPLPKRGGFRKAFEYAGEAMDAGYSILIFPEGEITKDGGLQKFQPGVGLLADGLEAAIIPIQITGLYEQKIRGRRFYAPPGSIIISIGQPILFAPDERPELIVSKLESQFYGN